MTAPMRNMSLRSQPLGPECSDIYMTARYETRHAFVSYFHYSEYTADATAARSDWCFGTLFMNQ